MILYHKTIYKSASWIYTRGSILFFITISQLFTVVYVCMSDNNVLHSIHSLTLMSILLLLRNRKLYFYPRIHNPFSFSFIVSSCNTEANFITLHFWMKKEKGYFLCGGGSSRILYGLCAIWWRGIGLKGWAQCPVWKLHIMRRWCHGGVRFQNPIPTGRFPNRSLDIVYLVRGSSTCKQSRKQNIYCSGIVLHCVHKT